MKIDAQRFLDKPKELRERLRSLKINSSTNTFSALIDISSDLEGLISETQFLLDNVKQLVAHINVTQEQIDALRGN